jgi:predicted enzyme related to lactoylglutathione lyase
MIRRAAGLVGAIAMAAGLSVEAAPMAGSPIVFFDIAGPDMARLKTFYADNFGWDIDAGGAIATPRLPGTLRQDPPEKIIYLGVADLDAAIAKVKASGGTIETPKLPTPTGETFVLFRDPAGNRMGMVQAKAP